MTTRKRAKPKLKAIPTFRSEDEEREFWATHDTVDYIDWSQARWVTFPNLKPSTETISLRLPAALLAEKPVIANRLDCEPAQVATAEERRSTPGAGRRRTGPAGCATSRPGPAALPPA